MPPLTATSLALMSPEEQFAGCGPAMRALTERHRQFVLALIANGFNGTEAAASAGFNGTRDVLAITACRLRKMPGIIAALQEEALTRINGDVAMATSVVASIANDPILRRDKPQVCLKAALELMNRVPQFAAEHKSTVTVEHKGQTRQQQVDDIIRLAQLAGVDPKKVLGSYGVVIDAEFKEVEVLHSIPGLEDCT